MSKFFLLLTLVFSINLGAQTKSDSLYDLINASSNWDEKADLAYSFAKLNITSNPDRILEIYNSIEQHKDQIKDSISLFNLYNIKGVIYQFRHEIDSSNNNFQEALRFGELLNDSNLVMKCLGNIAINYRKVGEYQKAVDASLRTLAYFKKVKDTTLIARAYIGIGNNYIYMKNYSEGMMYCRKALHLFKSVPDQISIANCYGSIAYIFNEKEELDSALYYAEITLREQEKTKSIYGIVNAKRTLCSIYKKINKSNQDLLDCNLELLELDLKVKDKRGIMLDNVNIGASIYNLGRINESLPYTEKALQLSRELDDDRVRLECYKAFALNYYELNEFEKAYIYVDSTRRLESELLNIEIQEAVLDADKKYQLADKERELLKIENEKIAAENEKAQAELKVAEKSKQLWLLGLGTLLLLAFGSFIFYRSKQNAKQKQAEIRIEEQQKGLNAVIHAQEEERKRIAKDLHDGIVQQLVGLKLGLMNMFHGKETEDSKNLIKVLSNSSEELREISHKMMPRSLAEQGLIPALEDMLKNSLGNTDIVHQFEHFGNSKRFKENIEIAIYRIAQELINNVIKHSNAKHVAVQLFKTGNNVILIVEDDGKGIAKNSKKDGIGLMNISSRLDTINGKVNFEPSHENGTLATVKIPLS